jgi:hypothetical protein
MSEIRFVVDFPLQSDGLIRKSLSEICPVEFKDSLTRMEGDSKIATAAVSLPIDNIHEGIHT